MSIITTAQAVPSRLFSLYAALADSPAGEPRERLEAWSTPPSLRTRGGSEEDGEGSTTLFTNTFAEARRLGLIEEEGEKIRLGNDARGGSDKKGLSEEQFKNYLLRTLFEPKRAAETQQAGFMLALAWLLTLNPLVPIGFREAPQNRLKATLGDDYAETELTSLNRYQNMLYWARYLGFAILYGSSDGDRRVIPDPTRAIQGAIPAIFAEAPILAASEFMARLSAIYPVFEGGSARQRIDQMSGHSSLSDDGKLSPATSFALQRLADARTIEFSQSADAAPFILEVGARAIRFSHIAKRAN